MVAAILTALLTVLAVAIWIGARRERRELSAQVDRLTRAGASDMLHTNVDTLDSVPAPVARYLRWALPERKSIRVARLQQVGTLRTDTRSNRWMPFEAAHTAVPPATGFVWDARVSIAPLLHVHVRDSLVDGQGSGRVTLLSAFPVASNDGTPETNSGSLHRFLAEAVWYPTALAPSSKLQWSAIDEHRALATLTVSGVSVSLEFRFADTGEVMGIFTPARWGSFDGGYQQRPWEGHFRNYQLRDGIRVPLEGDVGWYIDGEWQAVWRGIVTEFGADLLLQNLIPDQNLPLTEIVD